MIKVLITTSTFNHNNLNRLLKKKKFKVILNKTGKKVNENFLKKNIKDVDSIIAGTEIYSVKILKKAFKLQSIHRIGTGVDNIDLSYCKKNNIKVTISKTDLSIGVAEHSVGLLYSAIKKITYFNNLIKKNKWIKQRTNILSFKKIGVIGFGKIGKKIYRLLKPLNLSFYYNDKNKSKYSDVKFKSIKEIFKICDVVTIHLPLNKSTHHIINKKVLSKSNSKIILINTSRGEVIKETDLVKFLYKNKKSIAALDVFENEPYSGKLKNLPNTILTPHVSGYAEENRNSMENEAINNIIKEFSEK